jgi:arsenite methyltransferase
MTIHRDADIAPGAAVEDVVRERYAAGAQAAEAALCCPIDYDPKYLSVLPEEVLERDYGCGDPSAFVEEGDVVLDLGSGGGKICFISSQIVGARGRVIGLDMTDEMLDLARRSAAVVAERVGWDNCTFHKGYIQDLRTDMDRVGSWLADHPITDFDSLSRFEAWKRAEFTARPMIADDSIDVVVSNCVLNLVEPEKRTQMLQEIFRVLKKGGKAAISDIVCDEPVPQELQDDPTLWSGCISGAWEEADFLRAFERAGFHGIHIGAYQEEAWQTVNGIEFRSMTVVAYKGKQGPCWDHLQAVVYKGPFRSVLDDDAHSYPRGERVAVCKKTFDLLRNGPYAEQFLFIEPREAVSADDAKPFDCAPPARVTAAGAEHSGVALRSARETKGEQYSETIACAPGGCCC